ncbi:MAG: hypothetical protein ACXACR_17225 [Candidatus Hodarchaeales archaeon]|jgi:hypothetical protein
MLRNLEEHENHNQNPNKEILFFTSPFSHQPKLEKRLLKAIEKKELPIKVTKIDVLRAPEAAEEHDIIVCPTLIFRNFMKIYGNCEEQLEELVELYSSSEFKHQSSINHIGGVSHV